MPKFSSRGTSCSTRSDDFADYRWPTSQGGCAYDEEQGLPPDSRGGLCNTRCSDGYVSSPYLFIYVNFPIYILRLLFGSFHVNGISALVLFDSRAGRSFVSLALNKRVEGQTQRVESTGGVDFDFDLDLTLTIVDPKGL